MYTINALIIAVLVAVTEARGTNLKGTISDDLEQKPADILTSLSAEITKSDVEITLGGRVAEDVATDAIETNDDSRNDKNPGNLKQPKSENEAASISSAEDSQKITHTSDDNASFIHVKEKIARQSSVEEYAEADEQRRDRNGDDFIEHSEPKQTSDDLKNTEEKLPSKVAESKLLDKKEEEVIETIDSVGVDDTQDLFKFDAADVEDDGLLTQSRRMLSFDHKLLDAMNIPKLLESEPLLELKFGQNEYKLNSPEVDHYNHGHHEHHDGDSDIRSGYAPETNPLAFLPLNTPTLPPLALFHSQGQPPHPHLQLPDNTAKHPHSIDKSLLGPGFINNLHEHPHLDGNHNHHVNQHFKAAQQLYSHPFEQIKPVQTFQQFQLPQTLQNKPPLQPSQFLSTFQSLQPSHSLHSLESWQPFQSIHPPQPSSLATSSLSRSVTSFQPSQMKNNNILPRLQEAFQHPVHSEMPNQFSGALHKNWNWSM